MDTLTIVKCSLYFAQAFALERLKRIFIAPNAPKAVRLVLQTKTDGTQTFTVKAGNVHSFLVDPIREGRTAERDFAYQRRRFVEHLRMQGCCKTTTTKS